jgi:hypothetical protein
MRTFILLVLVVAAGFYAYTTQVQQSTAVSERSLTDKESAPSALRDTAPESSDALQRAFDNQQSDLQVQAAGVVDKLLSDDNNGSRHQRFIVKLASGQTVLIAHNIDLASRVPGLAVGDSVSVYGEYEWNNKGGVVHWTHRDPAGRHVGGWIKHHGKTYQ